MDSRRAQHIYVAVAWLFAAAAIGTFIAADRTSAGIDGRAPSSLDYRRSCLSILFYVASFGFGMTGAFWSLVGIILVRSPWVVACSVAAALNVSPLVLMVAMDTVMQNLAYRR